MREHGPLTRFVKLRVAHAPGMPGTSRRMRIRNFTYLVRGPWRVGPFWQDTLDLSDSIVKHIVLNENFIVDLHFIGVCF